LSSNRSRSGKRLIALVPRPWRMMLLYHGVLAPAASVCGRSKQLGTAAYATRPAARAFAGRQGAAATRDLAPFSEKNAITYNAVRRLRIGQSPS
jgi:hypothetical protein